MRNTILYSEQTMSYCVYVSMSFLSHCHRCNCIGLRPKHKTFHYTHTCIYIVCMCCACVRLVWICYESSVAVSMTRTHMLLERTHSHDCIDEIHIHIHSLVVVLAHTPPNKSYAISVCVLCMRCSLECSKSSHTHTHSHTNTNFIFQCMAQNDFFVLLFSSTYIYKSLLWYANYKLFSRINFWKFSVILEFFIDFWK